MMGTMSRKGIAASQPTSLLQLPQQLPYKVEIVVSRYLPRETFILFVYLIKRGAILFG